MSKKFDPGAPGQYNGKIFGFPYEQEEAELVIIPVPWEVTASYREGSSRAPQAILKASIQLDFYDPDLEKAWEHKVFMEPVSDRWKELNDKLRPEAVKYISALENGKDVNKNEALSKIRENINKSCSDLNKEIAEKTKNYIESGKKVGVLGGEHGSALGLLKALDNEYEEFGILQIDAHADLRKAYEGFEFSHASIMNNALELNSISKLVQVGVRDISPKEVERINSDERIKTFFDDELKRALYKGRTWEKLCNEIINFLPSRVYISYDIDGLNPGLCPNTGTPVPGGFQFEEVNHLLRKLVESGREIIGFDLVEVSPGQDEWDANVGARVLYKLCNFLKASST